MGKIIAVEGLPGSGKTTVIQLLIQELRRRGYSAELVDIKTSGYMPDLSAKPVEFPPGHPARTIHHYLLRLLQSEVMENRRKTTDFVFADRFWGTSLAYDMYGHRVPEDIMRWLGQSIKSLPDLTFYFDAPYDVVLSRKKTKTMADKSFARRVEQGYKKLAKAESWVRIDATKNPLKVTEDCLYALLGLWQPRLKREVVVQAQSS